MLKNSLSILLMLLVTACQQEDDMQRLKNDLAQKKINVIKNLKKPPQNNVLRLKKVTYENNARTPFEVTAALAKDKKNIQPLNLFAIDTLRFVGTITQGKKIWGVIITPDNLTYKVTLGDSLGNHYGRIIDISTNEMKVMESFNENDKTTTDRVVILQLKDE